MSHLITKLDTVYCPENGIFGETWHGLQTNVSGDILPDGSNVDRVFVPMVQAGFKVDFDSPLSELPEDISAEMGETVQDWKMILADARGNGNGVFPVHVAKKGYQIHQNKDLFAAFAKAAEIVLGKDGFEIATVGTLGACSQFFVSISIKGQSGFNVGANDLHKKFFNLISSHNGLVSSSVMLSIIRMVCMNTVQASMSDSEANDTISKIKRTKNSLALITPDNFAAMLKGWIATSERFQALLAAAKGVPMSLDGFRSFATGVFTNDGSDQISTTSFNRVSEMESLFARGKGNTGESLYDGLNAFTEFFTSGKGVGGRDVSTAKRIASANFGRGNEWKLESLRIASDETLLAETMKRGERFYADYLTVQSTAN